MQPKCSEPREVSVVSFHLEELRFSPTPTLATDQRKEPLGPSITWTGEKEQHA